ncbi:MAG TPA: rhodanese-like domain-containing protein [Accumulibacter sp.]|nr:rhodanese-like domain-containing protein [Accumulibacter sp.]HNB67191.1 rhodanese-like domain-containing protein [Accumulibacter sp.]HNI52810.1 rhodanese-like domain-containing protein [Accumulibacter sp.]HNM64204.1 rhodanese-like domain-containing protein [Accumulibacter sp.]
MWPRKAVLVSTLVSACLTTPAWAADDKPDTPGRIRGGKVVSVDEAKSLLDKKSAAFFDTRNAPNFGKGHVPGAAIVSYKEKSDFSPTFDGSQDAFELAKLPAEKGAQVVFYSDGPKGWKSYKAATLAINAGYKNALWMREGFAGWTARSLPVAQ